MADPTTPAESPIAGEPTADVGSALDPAGVAPDATPDSTSIRRRPSRLIVAVGALAVLAVVAAVAAWQAVRPPASPPVSPGAASGLPPLIALVDPSGALVTVDLAGRRTPLAGAPGITSGFPAWSPDGRRVAAIRAGGSDTAVSIFGVGRDAAAATTLPASAPVDIYRSAERPPFYLYWAPDGQRVSFLATEADEVSLRIAPADGSAPLDGSGPGAMVRRGLPLYFDWVAGDRLLLHVGDGEDAFLGEVGLDGAATAPSLPGTGEFRSAVVGRDGRFIAYVRGRAPTSTLVVAARDGGGEHAVPVFGPTATVFDPSGGIAATIAAVQPMDPALAFPIGPLRLVDGGTGTVRTLLDGTVVGFFWSPDGRTIAALRLQSGSGSTTAARPVVLAAAITAAGDPSAVPSPTAPTPPANPEVHLLFLNVADGAIQSDRVVRLTRTFVNQFLPYFDQYALSHRVWAPDSSALLLPLVDATGSDQLVVLAPDGRADPLTFEGQSGFWSP